MNFARFQLSEYIRISFINKYIIPYFVKSFTLKYR